MRSVNSEKLFNCCFLCLFIAYAIVFWNDVSQFWFNPEWTTDDSLQQVYPFHKVFDPDLFKDDFITETMEGYLAPLHYWLSWGITYLTGDPLMMAHWMMLIQLVLCFSFVFFSVRHLSTFWVACFSCFWLLHTRITVQRFTSGLPRGWSAVVIAAFIYFALKKKHRSILLTLLAGCLLHPPGAFVCALAYGCWLFYGVVSSKTRNEYKRPFIELCMLAPFYIAIVLYVVWRPPEVGQMVTYSEALHMPEFQRPHGRFPFVPLRPVFWEYRMFAIQPFWQRLYNPHEYVKKALPWLVLFFLFVSASLALRSKKLRVPRQLWFMFAAIVASYFLSRLLAFRLYVPDRHLQLPLSIFWVVYTPVFIYLLCKERSALFRSLTFAAFTIFIFICSGTGLEGTANFNYSKQKHGKVFIALDKFTPKDALVAGHPTHIDGVPLFAKRQAYATTETAHPFYPLYFKEISRRLRLSLQAHYAERLEDVVKLMEPEGVDYFVFSKKRFYPEALEEERYFEPINPLVKELTSRHYTQYAYRQLFKINEEANEEVYPFVIYHDDYSAIVNIQELKKFLSL